MKIKKVLLLSTIFVLLVVPITVYGAEKAGPAEKAKTTGPVEKIVIITPVWEYYTEKSGKGLYHELWKEIYQSAGIEVVVDYAPYKRCQAYFKPASRNLKYDSYPGDYPSPGVLTPKWNIGIELLTIAYKKGSEWKGTESFKGKRVGWLRGYLFDDIGMVPADIVKSPFDKLESGLKMLAAGRVDYIVDYEQAMRDTIKELKLEKKIDVLYNKIKGPKYYMVFHDTEKSKKLIEIWDKGMERLHKSGKLHELYKKYEDQAY
jgi:polar amino acid transport system substrate-binding protein